MPIFMDRHDVSDATTAENVAQLHQQDLEIQDQFGCRGLTYWFDGKRKTAFCLIEAADRDAIVRMHNHAHGQVPHRVIEVDPGIVESFLGRIEDPDKTGNTDLIIIDEPAFRIIMVLRFTRQSLDDKFAIPSYEYISIATDAFNNTEGSIVKQTEAGFLVSFKSVTNAVNAGSLIQAGFMNSSRGEVAMKMALSAGVPVTERQSLFEDAKKSAERMCLVVPGEIIVTSEVRDLYNSENIMPLQEGKLLRAISPNEERFLNGIFDYMDINWKKTGLKIDDLRKSLGYSRSQLYRLIILLTGQSPNNFINEYRLSKALTLLRKGSNNITEVAFESGFSDLSYFSKCFQKKYGHLPSRHLIH